MKHWCVVAVQLLCKGRANLDYKCHGKSVLQLLQQRSGDEYEAISRVLESHSERDVVINAVKSGDVQKLKTALRAGANPNRKDCQSRSAVWWAVDNGDDAVENGDDVPDYLGPDGVSVVHPDNIPNDLGSNSVAIPRAHSFTA